MYLVAPRGLYILHYYMPSYMPSQAQQQTTTQQSTRDQNRNMAATRVSSGDGGAPHSAHHPRCSAYTYTSAALVDSLPGTFQWSASASVPLHATTRHLDDLATPCAPLHTVNHSPTRCPISRLSRACASHHHHHHYYPPPRPSPTICPTTQATTRRLFVRVCECEWCGMV